MNRVKKSDILDLHQVNDMYFTTSNYKSTGHHDERRYCCPFCGDKTYHLYYNTIQGIWYCFHCQRSGKSKIEELSMAITKTEPDIQPKRKGKLINVIGDSFIQKAAYNYWKGRGLTKWDLINFDVKLNVANLSLQFPVYDEDGQHIFDIQRKIYKSDRPYYIDKFTEKKKYLYNLHRAKNYNTIYICEGVFDVISIGMNAVGLLGKVLSNEMVQKLKKCRKVKKIYVLLDVDAVTDANRIFYRLISELNKETRILYIGNEDYKDIAEFRQMGKRKDFKRFLSGDEK